MRTIKQQHRALSAPIGDLVTYRALPTPSLEHLDPFLFLNHHGPQVYAPHNQGLPFGPHPHRGFETVTFILDGDIMHQDTGGHQSVIQAGGVQWMTAGRGLIHAEVSSPDFKRAGGPLEILQLWVNLPARAKLTEPRYVGLQEPEIPVVALPGGGRLQAVSGRWLGMAGAVTSPAGVALAVLTLPAGASLSLPVPAAHTVFFYTVRGQLQVNGTATEARHLVEFNYDGDELHLDATTDAVLLLGHGQPFREPIVAYGPFVMNTEAEIRQAYQDYQAGRFGRWEE